MRGLFVLYETLVLGTRMLMRSAALAAEGEDIEIGRGTLAVTMIFSLGFAIGLFFVLPLLLSEASPRRQPAATWSPTSSRGGSGW